MMMKKILLSVFSLLTVLGLQAQSPLALTIEDFKIVPGEMKQVYIAMQNEGYDIIAIEFKMELSEGLSLKGKPTLTDDRIGSGIDDFGETVASAKTVNGSKNAAGYWTFSIFSMKDQFPFAGTEGNVIEMNIVADAGMSIGDTSVRLYDIELSTKGAPYYPVEYSNKVIVCDEATGINEIGRLDNLQSDHWYDLQGRKIIKSSNRQMKPGAYIVTGKKVIVQ